VSNSISAAEVFRWFGVMSNELSTPLILVCPADNRTPAKDFGPGFTNHNLSYFVGIDATDSNPQGFLAGDRNLTNGTPTVNGILTMSTNTPVGWTHTMHRFCGNIALADGSVQQLSNSRLQSAVAGTNRLAMP
jgi:hypothetical protein